MVQIMIKKIIVGTIAVIATATFTRIGMVVAAHAQTTAAPVNDAAMTGEKDTTMAGAKAEAMSEKETMAVDRMAMQKKFTEDVEAKRMEAKAMIVKKAAVFAKRVAVIKNADKKQLAIKAAEELNRINQNVTQHFEIVLTQLDDFVSRIETKMNALAGEGKNVTALKAAVAKADQAIAAARAKVKTQIAKVYDVTFTGETKLHEQFKAAREKLHDDLTALRDGSVRPARDATHDAVQILRELLSTKVDTNASSQ